MKLKVTIIISILLSISQIKTLGQNHIEIVIQNCLVHKEKFNFSLWVPFDTIKVNPVYQNNLIFLRFKTDEDIGVLNISRIREDTLFSSTEFLVPLTEKNKFFINCKKNEGFSSKHLINYSKYSDSLENFLSPQYESANKIFNQFENFYSTEDSLQILRSKFANQHEKIKLAHLDFYRERPNQISTLMCLFYNSRQANYYKTQDFLDFFLTLSPEFQKSKIGLECRKNLLHNIVTFKNQPKLDSLNKINFQKVDIYNNKFDFTQQKGKITLINFWFMGCAPCVYEIPELVSLKSEYPNLDIISFSTDKEIDKLKVFVAVKKMLWTHIQADEAIRVKFNIKGYPTNILIDENGYFKYIKMGVINRSEIERFLK
ncbi:MAG: TlpA family protein disulfide reductase [Cytophagaceae bacterium]|nr:TlpA family protein disulfide reductase [Cytophagaceae bacterium]MBL0300239.1 TlpA family protein disulfide reductase [Cytophagaceae bacterium]MBL0327175.1 TlpA family protein disulfide reductase [Cytophagaceae bacterium]